MLIIVIIEIVENKNNGDLKPYRFSLFTSFLPDAYSIFFMVLVLLSQDLRC